MNSAYGFGETAPAERNGVHRNEVARTQIVQAFTQTVEAQNALGLPDMQLASYLLDMAKLEMATHAERLIGGSPYLSKREEEMIFWFRRKVVEDIERPDGRSAPN